MKGSMIVLLSMKDKRRIYNRATYGFLFFNNPFHEM